MLRAKHPPRRHVFHVSGRRWGVADTLISAIPAYLTCPATLCKAVGDGRCFAGNCLPTSDQGLSLLLLPDVCACGRHKSWRTVSRRHIHQAVRLNKVIYLHCSRLLRNLASATYTCAPRENKINLFSSRLLRNSAFSRIYLCASGEQNKFVLLSASAYICARFQRLAARSNQQAVSS